jgi:diadenosine tetraphosphate (Ap4A) HIT family hydrolase
LLLIVSKLAINKQLERRFSRAGSKFPALSPYGTQEIRIAPEEVMMAGLDCILCRGVAGDEELERVRVWEDELWRLTVSLAAESPSFSYLEPKRHIAHITDLDGPEAASFGSVLARVTSALKAETGAKLVYVHVFGGGVPHLHLHLAPHIEGDALNEQMIRGEIVEEKQPNGTTRFFSKEFPALPKETLAGIAERVGRRLAK